MNKRSQQKVSSFIQHKIFTKMKTIKYIKLLLSLLFAVFVLNSCKKENKTGADIFYSVSLDGYTVTFSNQTTNAVSYKWDFGDGESSTEENPVHTYPGKGKYVPTLYATSTDGITTEGSTVINISKNSAVSLTDNSFSDWDTVTHNVVAGAGTFTLAKFDYNSENVYFYFEMNTKESNGEIYDFYIDADNDATTGYTTGSFTGGGYDVLLEGTMLDGWFDPFYHSGSDQNAFSFEYQSISEFYEIGTVQQTGNTLKIEGRLKRAKLKGLTGKGLKIGITATKNDWSATVGTLPPEGSDAFYLDMSE